LTKRSSMSRHLALSLIAIMLLFGAASGQSDAITRTNNNPHGILGWFEVLKATTYVQNFAKRYYNGRLALVGNTACIIPFGSDQLSCHNGAFDLGDIAEGVMAGGHHVAVISFDGGGNGAVTSMFIYDLSMAVKLSRVVQGQSMGPVMFEKGKLIIESSDRAGAGASRIQITYEQHGSKIDQVGDPVITGSRHLPKQVDLGLSNLAGVSMTYSPYKDSNCASPQINRCEHWRGQAEVATVMAVESIGPQLMVTFSVKCGMDSAFSDGPVSRNSHIYLKNEPNRAIKPGQKIALLFSIKQESPLIYSMRDAYLNGPLPIALFNRYQCGD
jgi:hypothetical protein